MSEPTPSRIIAKPKVVGVGNARQLMLTTDVGEMTIAEAAARCGISYQTLYSRVAYDDDRWSAEDVFQKGRLHRSRCKPAWSTDGEGVRNGPAKKKPMPATIGRLEREAAKQLEVAVQKDRTTDRTEYKQALRRHLGLDRD
jgi:hypothetical protein